ncbi:RecT family recombinase [[Kitasatospora] papulosa]|uniref:RecT family recombinase n=1 Tax=Streptomyces TaxID=1883 RepID=UPI002FF248E4
MAASSLMDRVKAATSAPVPAARRSAPADDSQHDQAADTAPAAGTESADAALVWLRRYESHFVDALPACVDSGQFFAAARALLPDLIRRQASPASMLQSLLTCARFGLIPDGRQAAISVESRQAVFIPMYQGYIDLMYRSGRVDSVRVGLVHQADEWSYEPSAPSPDDFKHKARVELSKEDRGPGVLAYAFCWLAGGARSQVIVLSREDAEEIRDEHSTAYQRAEESGKRDSFWHLRFDHMWAKSAIRRLAPLVPTSAELRALVAVEDAGEARKSQILLAPLTDAETAALVADAEEAAEHAEGAQETALRPLPVKASAARRGRSKPKKDRAAGRASRRRAA